MGRILLEKDLSEYLKIDRDKVAFDLPDKFVAPISLIWEITGKCNSNCVYCSGSFPRKVVELSKKEKIELAKEICNMGVFMICLSGGEPLTNEDLLDIVPIFLENNVDVMVCTSGYMIDYKILDELLKMGRIAFNISIDSVRESINDYQRGRNGAYDAAINLVDYIRKNERVPSFISIEAVATKKNYTYMAELVKFFNEKYGINEVRIQPVVTMNTKVVEKGLEIHQEEFQECQKAVNDFIEEYNAMMNVDERTVNTCVRFINQFKLIETGLKTGRTWGGVITPEGNFLLSVYLPENLGNVYQEGSFKQSWDKKFANAWLDVRKKSEITSLNSVYDIKKLYV